MSNENGLEILIDESCLCILLEELNKFIKFYNLEMEISSREVLYSFFKKSNSRDHIFSNDIFFCDIEFKANDHEKLLTKEEFALNILLMGQFLFNYQDASRHRPHDIGMNNSHVSYLKGCFRGQEVIARTEHLSKKKKEIIPIKAEDEASIKSKKIKTLKKVKSKGSTFKLVSFIPL